MKHARQDYNRIQDPLNLIPRDEPVFLLRGQDVNTVETLANYCRIAEKNGANRELLTSVQEHITAIMRWQHDTNATERRLKIPDLKSEIESAKIMGIYEASGQMDLINELEDLRVENEELKKANSHLTERLDTLKDHEKRNRIFGSEDPVTETKQQGNTIEYEVLPGDNLTKIAKKYGVEWTEIYELNKDQIANPHFIMAGWKLKIPVKQIPEQDTPGYSVS